MRLLSGFNQRCLRGSGAAFAQGLFITLRAQGPGLTAWDIWFGVEGLVVFSLEVFRGV